MFGLQPASVGETGTGFTDLTQHPPALRTAFAGGGAERRQTLTSMPMGACRLSRVDAGADGVHATVPPIWPADPEAIRFMLQSGGLSLFDQGGTRILARPGSCLVYDPTGPHVIRNLSDVSQILLQVPRHSFSPAALRQFSAPRHFEACQPGLAHVLSNLLQDALDNAGALDAAARCDLGSSLVRLSTCLVEPRQVEPPSREQSLATLRARAAAYVERDLARPTLDIADIARHMGCSRRYVFRAFEADGITPSHFIWTMRLERAHERLRSRWFRDSSVSEIAFSCGFSCTAHFSRSFKKRYGIRPSDLRQASLADPVVAAHTGSAPDS